MKTSNPVRLAVILCLLMTASFLIAFKHKKKTYPPKTGYQRCLIVSDIHFSPIFASTESDTVLKKKLSVSSYEQWIQYFESTKAQMELDSTLMFKDSNYALLRSAMANMKRRLAHPAFIVIAGDFIWHGATPADSLLKKRTIQFITRLFKEYFPGSLIVPTMGNNDTYGDDYALQNTSFLKDFATAWEPNLPSGSANMLKQQGYYTCETGNMEFVVLNTAPLNAGTHYPEGQQELQWLKTTLANAAGKNVWLVMHIPPGLNSYNQKDFWNDDVNTEFVDDIVKSAQNIRVSIASHTHFDDFKVIYDNSSVKAPVSLVRIVSSICANHGNYPSFDIAELNVSGQLINETNWYLNLAKAYVGINPEKVIWADSISLRKNLGIKATNAASFSQFISDIKANPAGQPLKNYAFVTSVASPVGTSLLNTSSYMKYLKADSLKQK